MVSEFIKSVKVKQGSDADCYVKYGLTPLEMPKNIRIKFLKTGSLQYISHLDLHRLINRALVRAGIPIWYTQGFNPHAKMVFALPLPVGVESVCEYLDVKIDKEIPNDDVKELLNKQLTEELQVIEVYDPTTKFAAVAKAEYRILLESVSASPEMAAKINEFFGSGSPVMMTKKTKSGEKDIDITALIHGLKAEFCGECGKIKINTTLTAGAESLSPEFIMAALRKYEVLPTVALTDESYSIMRLRVLTEDGREFR